MNADKCEIVSLNLDINHLLYHQIELQEYLHQNPSEENVSIQKLHSLLAEIWITDDFKMIWNEITTTTTILQGQLYDSINNKSISDLRNSINCLIKDIEEIENSSHRKTFQEHIPRTIERKNEIEEITDSNILSKFTHKIHLSNNAIRWIRGPIRVIFNGTMRIFDVLAKHTHISSSALQAVANGLIKQKQSAFVEITSDWTFISKNLDQGFNSESVWMYDPRGRRILVKTQEHPLCAANEWLVYILGNALGLPVNEVQIGVYQNKLVTLHKDVRNENETMFTFMELSRQTRKRLLTDPILGCMDFFDHIIQNADRNQRNILITISTNTATDINDLNAKMKIYLIDHASCFGLGKLSIISLVACKFHTNHLTIVKFDPIEQARKFEQYLNSLSITDRLLIRDTANRFAAITDRQFTDWLDEVKELLSENQYNRIYTVLTRQRDVAKYHTAQIDDHNDPVTYF
ncbi:hypothetical protein I4U23_015357 [Adineta vaga]|nr:hypothetical protein I4U23_015357 [Adineta vaga]